MLLTEIDDLLRDEHYHLTDEDKCFALREYITGGGYQAGETNQLIFNLKKKNDRRDQPDWKYKERAIRQAGRELREAVIAKWLNGAVLVPAPPSKAKTDPEYDDRMVRVVRVMCEGTGAELRELLVTKESRDANHLQDRSRDVDRIADNLEIDEALAKPKPTRIALVDDVLTTGAQFRACKRVLLERFPSAVVIGLFIARRAIAKEEDADL